ncbi:DMT family transporter [Alkalicoccus luteus]|uniref:DMT family transporter n=1 Tax=Alkalicoccus luteus TaxID=1237094 RepID=A0A969TWA5_9BACI|nr:DMT family transporter [Alkalicoccus luteus]NJP39250.1 DMT family transporter [Alkalicoccus luteus]
MVLVYGLLTAVFLGVGDFLAGQTTKKVSAILVVFYAQLIGALFMMIIVSAGSYEFTLAATGWGLAAGIALGVGFMQYFKALSLGKMGIVASITGILSALIPVVTGIVTGERPGALSMLAIVLIVLAVIPIAKKDSEDVSRSENLAIFTRAIAAGMLIGLFFVLLHIPEASSAMFSVTFTMIGSFAAVAILLLVNRQPMKVKGSMWIYIAGTGILQTLATITYVNGVQIGMMSIVALGGALSALFTVICARIIIKESLNRTQLKGVGLALVGLTILVLSV